MESLEIANHEIDIAFSSTDKWKLVEDEVVSVHDVKELRKKSEDDIHREYSQCFSASGLLSLKNIRMNVSSKSFDIYKSLFPCTIGRLVDLEFCYNYGSDDSYF